MADVYSEIDSPETQDNTEGQGHPLFPRGEHETGPDKRRIELLQVDRTREDGTLEHCPRYFKAGEIRSWQDIVDRFGGGAYRLRALCGKTYQFQGSTERREFFGPPPRPMADDARSGQRPTPRQEAAPQLASPPLPQSAAPTAPGWPAPAAGWPWPAPQNGISPEILALLLKSMERPATSHQDQIMAIVLKGMLDQQTALVKMAFDRPSTPGALETLQQIKPLLDSTNGVAQLIKGVELAKSLHTSAPAAADQGEDVLGMFTQMLQKLTPTATAAPTPPPAPPAPPPLPAPPLVPDRAVLQTIVHDPALRKQFLEMMREEAERTRAPSIKPASRPAAPAEPPTSSSAAGPSRAAPTEPAATNSTAKAAELAGPGTKPAQDHGTAKETASPADGFDLCALPFFDEPEFRRAIASGQRHVMIDAIEAAQQQHQPPTPPSTAPPAAA